MDGLALDIKSKKRLFRICSMNLKITAVSVLFLPLYILSIGCSSTKYVRIEDPSDQIVSGCILMQPPEDGDWYVDKHWTEILYGANYCEDRLRLSSGGGSDIYHIYITSGLRSWSDKLSNEYLINWVKNYHDRQLLNNKDLNLNVGHYKSETCNELKDICVKSSYAFVSDKRLQFKAGGPATTYGDRALDISDKYFYEVIEFYVFEGPYEVSDEFGDTFYYEVMYVHVSVDEKRDPRLEDNAVKVLRNISLNKSWEKKADT